MKYIISYDLGTGGTKASLFDETGKSLADSFIGCRTYFPKSGFHEQRPEDWWQSVVESTRLLLEKTRVNPDEIEALAVSGHSLGAVPIGEKGELLTEYTPIWSDSRADQEAEAFFRTVDYDSWYLDTGNGFPAPLYSIFKIMWLKNHQPDIYQKTVKFIGTKDYINLKLTGIAATDRSYASGSGMYSLKKEQYENAYIRASGIDPDKLPDIYPSAHVLGRVSEEAAQITGLSVQTKVCCGGVDNACMALGAACMKNGEAYTSLGTSAWIAVSSDQPIVNLTNKTYVFAHAVPGQYVSATCIFSAGNSFRWLKQLLYGDAEQLDGKSIYQYMDELAAQSPAGANGLLFVPTLAGGCALDESPNAKGCFAGLELRHTRSDMIRAALEGICLHLRMALDVLEKNTPVSHEMLIVGGGAKSSFWKGLFADIYEKEILEANVGQDAGSFGAAAIAMTGSGLWEDFDQLREAFTVKSRILPQESSREVYQKLRPVFAEIAAMQSRVGDLITELHL